MVKALQFLFDNFVYKAIATVLAIALWASTQGFREEEVSVNIDVALESTPPGVVVVSQSAKQINLRLVGSRWAVQRAEQDMEAYPISLLGAEPGELRIEVNPDRVRPPRGAKVVTWSPSDVLLKLDEVTEQPIRVRVETMGELPKGLRLEGIEVEPSIVDVRGARTVLARLREVGTSPIRLPDITASSERELDLVIGSPYAWLAKDEVQKVRVLVRVARVAPEPEAEAAPDAG